MERIPIIDYINDPDPEIEAALAAGDYTVVADNYLTVAGYELHRDESEWHWSVEQPADAGTKELCWSRGPRIGDEGVPYCKLPHPHQGFHRPGPEDGWGPDVVWGDPAMRQPQPHFDGGETADE